MTAASITIKDLISVVADSTGATKTKSEQVIVDLFAKISEALKAGQDVTVRDFGRFFTKVRAPRVARNPKTGAAVNVEAKTIIKFTPRGSLK